jgi:hypothetical protein
MLARCYRHFLKNKNKTRAKQRCPLHSVYLFPAELTITAGERRLSKT